MAKTHQLKTLPVYFDAVKRGDKTFEICKNDRDFQTGDMLVLREYDPAKMPGPPAALANGMANGILSAPPSMPGDYTGAEIMVRVSYVFHDVHERYGLGRGYAILGLVIVGHGGGSVANEIKEAIAKHHD